eukprot:7116050-Prymnesium_polylepis.2
MALEAPAFCAQLLGTLIAPPMASSPMEHTASAALEPTASAALEPGVAASRACTSPRGVGDRYASSWSKTKRLVESTLVMRSADESHAYFCLCPSHIFDACGGLNATRPRAVRSGGMVGASGSARCFNRLPVFRGRDCCESAAANDGCLGAAHGAVFAAAGAMFVWAESAFCRSTACRKFIFFGGGSSSRWRVSVNSLSSISFFSTSHTRFARLRRMRIRRPR